MFSSPPPGQADGLLCPLFARRVLRHGGACPGHPRLWTRDAAKTGMPCTRPGMTA